MWLRSAPTSPKRRGALTKPLPASIGRKASAVTTLATVPGCGDEHRRPANEILRHERCRGCAALRRTKARRLSRAAYRRIRGPDVRAPVPRRPVQSDLRIDHALPQICPAAQAARTIVTISYAVFCLKKKYNKHNTQQLLLYQ